MVATAPAEMHSRARPSALCEAETWARTSGIRTTQDANRKPSTVKKAVRARRAADQEELRPDGVFEGAAERREERASVLFSSGTKSE
ncbi:hypothetical protein GCM10009759_20960 [Kitasatospora saccharophila]|uniref:Uncharacterized protein n=1 Tax=Kitasatospora saccharophila TaxID=407973 RepID=A0ABP5I4L5_9ACTN